MQCHVCPAAQPVAVLLDTVYCADQLSPHKRVRPSRLGQARPRLQLTESVSSRARLACHLVCQLSLHPGSTCHCRPGPGPGPGPVVTARCWVLAAARHYLTGPRLAQNCAAPRMRRADRANRAQLPRLYSSGGDCTVNTVQTSYNTCCQHISVKFFTARGGGSPAI